MTSTVVQYGVQYAPGGRPVATFGSYAAAEAYLEDNPPHANYTPGTDPNIMIVERIILTGDWYPAERPTP